MIYKNKKLQSFLIFSISGQFKPYRFQNERLGFLNLVQLQFVLRRFEVFRQLLCVMQYPTFLTATDELGLDDGVNAVSVATVDSVKNSFSEDKDKQEDKSNKDEFTIASVYNENRQARGDVGKVREDDSKTNKLNNAGDLDAKENDKLVKEVSKELSGAEAALYNDENTDAKKQNYKGMYDGEENKVYVNIDKTDITDAGEYVNLVYHENRHAQKTQEGIENTADQEELVTHYGDRTEKLWEDANRREGKTTGGTTQKTISEWRQENNANYPSVFKNSEASEVDNEQPASLKTIIDGNSKDLESKTVFDPKPEDAKGEIFMIKTRNKVIKSALPGATDAFKTDDVSVLYVEGNKAYGIKGAYIDTNDPRGRDIHGGGSGLAEPFIDYQGWVPTKGCTRGQNKDILQLGDKIKEFKKQFPKVKIPYERIYAE